MSRLAISKTCWGIDLGGTKTEGVILSNGDPHQPLLRTRLPTESHKGYDHILSTIVTLVDKMKTDSGLEPESVGFGTPGILDPESQVMKNCNSTALNGKPLKKDLENLLCVPVILANDANCFALAESKWGAVHTLRPNARMVFGVIMGTGVGGGIVMDGKIWSGLHGIAGEWGHNFLDESGGPCYCGKTGCVETVLSGPALQRYFFDLTGQTLSLAEIHGLSGQGHQAAMQTIDRLCEFFARAISVVINMIDPEAIILGGGVSNIPELYSAGRTRIGNYIFNNRSDVPILGPVLGDSAGVFGAAALVSD